MTNNAIHHVQKKCDYLSQCHVVSPSLTRHPQQVHQQVHSEQVSEKRAPEHVKAVSLGARDN